MRALAQALAQSKDPFQNVRRRTCQGILTVLLTEKRYPKVVSQTAFQYLQSPGSLPRLSFFRDNSPHKPCNPFFDVRCPPSPFLSHMAELIWDGKYDAHGNKRAPVHIELSFQTVETVNESGAGTPAHAGAFF